MRKLPIVKIGRKRYFVDTRLNEMRNVRNPHDKEKMEGSEKLYVELFKDAEVKYEREVTKQCEV
jgi:hypothetical protein